jgi:hypothetical protein
MDPFAVIVLVGVGVTVGCLLLLGKYYPGTGMEQIRQPDARQITETQEALDAQDLDQMLAAHNARRRARGEAEMSAGDVERRVRADAADQQRRREDLMAERELDQLLEATNARRRKRGLPERTLAEVREEFGGGPARRG